jgi:CRISPR/Cas system-associated protein Cas10 (large subunit of type III CRISPR-Cas system)
MWVCSAPLTPTESTTVRPPEFDCHILTFDIAGLGQAFAECRYPIGVMLRRAGMQKSDHWHRRLLRARSERPSRRRAAEKRDELSPPHELPSDEAHNLAHKRACASLRNLPAYVGSGSDWDIRRCLLNVRFAPVISTDRRNTF